MEGFFDIAFETKYRCEVAEFGDSGAAFGNPFFGFLEEFPGAVFFLEVAMFENEVLPVGVALSEDFVGPVDECAFAELPIGRAGRLLDEEFGFDGLEIGHEFLLEVFEFSGFGLGRLVNESKDLEEEGFSESDDGAGHFQPVRIAKSEKAREARFPESMSLTSKRFWASGFF